MAAGKRSELKMGSGGCFPRVLVVGTGEFDDVVEKFGGKRGDFGGRHAVAEYGEAESEEWSWWRACDSGRGVSWRTERVRTRDDTPGAYYSNYWEVKACAGAERCPRRRGGGQGANSLEEAEARIVPLAPPSPSFSWCSAQGLAGTVFSADRYVRRAGWRTRRAKDDFKALVRARQLGRYFRDEDGQPLFPDGELKALYPEG